MSKVSSAAPRFYQPLQLEVVPENGTECVVHAICQVSQQNGKKPEYGMLSINLTNAFNLVSRNAFLIFG